ncbi:MAG: stage II sporulation protein D [Clostridia bacterium]|nr:stage II sporulation protein D [Clostridia bacterium]MDD4376034.1 stage II sporulation protein D [Clostridia bacterium]
MNKKLIMYYAFFCTLTLIIIIIFLINIKRWEQEKQITEKIEKEIEEVKKYDKENKVSRTIRLKISNTGEVQTIDMDEYLKGVLPSEMPPSYEMEALKAQAVVARTYAYEKMSTNTHEGFDICDNFACCQAYYNKEKISEIWTGRGFDKKTRDKYWEKINEAVDSTNNIAVVYSGKFIKAYFHANSGGKTESASEIWGKQKISYLEPVESRGEEEHSYYKSNESFTAKEIENKINSKSEVKCRVSNDGKDEIEILSHTVSGRVKKVRVGENIYEATFIRAILGLKSTNFSIEKKDNKIIFNVTGYGHGVGMSQTGANYYAKEGYIYDQIIKHYYKGVDVVKVEQKED